ncbi:hypothetical protein GKC33_14710 (plasmid) [Lactobacillus salivarius]|uniref:Uncharacterized protein n=1 Tax=Ligilactobacillus salivarius TaxID=1624 RepID=A0A7X2MI82_9LACO|nr:hypothetical protein [Ligilactobacillus salivarius]
MSKRTDAKILIIIFKLLDGSLIVFCFRWRRKLHYFLAKAES